MKKIIAFCLILVILCLSACGEETVKNKTSSKSETSANETIGTKTEKTYKNGKSVTKEAKASTSFTDPKVTYTGIKDKNDKKSTSSTDAEYQLKIEYKSLSDLKKKVSKYKTLKSVLDSGKISKTKNAQAINSFNEQGLEMIFNSKYYYLPNVPKGYKLKKIYLTSSNFFTFIYTDKKKKKCALRIYTTYDTDQTVSRFTLSFTDKNGNDIYKNRDGKYCWYDINDYIILFTGKDKSFINNLSLTQESINYTPVIKGKKKKKK